MVIIYYSAHMSESLYLCRASPKIATKTLLCGVVRKPAVTKLFQMAFTHATNVDVHFVSRFLLCILVLLYQILHFYSLCLTLLNSHRLIKSEVKGKMVDLVIV